jgi:hypothetical protein
MPPSSSRSFWCSAPPSGPCRHAHGGPLPPSAPPLACRPAHRAPPSDSSGRRSVTVLTTTRRCAGSPTTPGCWPSSVRAGPRATLPFRAEFTMEKCYPVTVFHSKIQSVGDAAIPRVCEERPSDPSIRACIQCWPTPDFFHVFRRSSPGEHLAFFPIPRKLSRTWRQKLRTQRALGAPSTPQSPQQPFRANETACVDVMSMKPHALMSCL